MHMKYKKFKKILNFTREKEMNLLKNLTNTKSKIKDRENFNNYIILSNMLSLSMKLELFGAFDAFIPASNIEVCNTVENEVTFLKLNLQNFKYFAEVRIISF